MYASLSFCQGAKTKLPDGTPRLGTYRELHGNVYAWGNQSAGLFARASETLVDEPGTEHVSDNGHAWGPPFIMRCITPTPSASAIWQSVWISIRCLPASILTMEARVSPTSEASSA